ncbi:hypothetical protein EMPS_09962 [Entomortierella parvispora]|uniref:Transmembrane protein n=1 Tax=Entomortierella parvispora TaxID=205924 RepID=A0A9P3M0T6_9FUNG|nr:hypothetical protein EMPS_09962 [Entomortierella parvispora]
MEIDSPYDDWSRNIHAVITFLQPFFDDWRAYAGLVSSLLGIGVLIMENQVLLRMRMGRWEILGYVLWCIISSMLGPIFDIVVMLGLLLYCRQKSNRMHITNETIAKALLPPPVAANYRIMGAVCITATFLTLCSNVLYMLRGWQEPLPFYDWSSNGIRWMTSQIWYAIGMIFLFHVVTRPAQSGVVLFGKFPRDLWSFKWYLGILYMPIHYLLLELCNVHKDSRHILIPLEIIVDVVLYNGPFLVVLLRLLYLAWKVAYDEAVLTGAIYEDESGHVESPALSIGSFFFSSTSSSNGRRPATSGSSSGNYVGLAMTDLDEEAELGQSRTVVRGPGGITSTRSSTQNGSEQAQTSSSSYSKGQQSLHPQDTLSKKGGESRELTSSSKNTQSQPKVTTKTAPRTSPRNSPRPTPRNSPRTSPKASSPLRNMVIFNMDSSDEEDSADEVDAYGSEDIKARRPLV